MPTIPEVRVVGYALLLHFLWEWLQSPFYADTFEESFLTLFWNRAHCTLGDGLITLVAFWSAALVGGGRQWYRASRLPALVVFLMSGLAYTAWSEYWNVQVVRTWDYSPWMPVIWGIGMAPLAQWIILPPLVLRLTRRGRSTPMGEGERENALCR